MSKLKAEVAIIGAGPSGLLLSQLLNRAGIETVLLERASRQRVLARIRAGVLEPGTVSALEAAGVAERLHREGIPHDGCWITSDEEAVHIDFAALTGKRVTVYGQTEVTQDLYAAQDAMGTTILHEAQDVRIEGAGSDAPVVHCTRDGEAIAVSCRYVVGCDGFHGVSRRTIPATLRREYERVYPFGWLGILSKTPPVDSELIYASSAEGFALASMRREDLVRYYVQVPLSDDVEDWPDDRFWEAFRRRIPPRHAARLVTGPSVEKSIAPLRSFLSEPLRWGSLFLAGDAAHIVPPTGAKGLNLAVSDVHYLHRALIDALRRGDKEGIDGYSETALRRIRNAMRFSWQMTTMLHAFDDDDAFSAQMRRATLRHLEASEAARRDLADNYVGLPF